MHADGKLATYTADTAWFDDLPEACGEADLLICEATYIDGTEAEPDVHLWAPETGTAGAKSGAKKLLLTHVWGTYDPAQAAREASKTYGGTAEPAEERRCYTVSMGLRYDGCSPATCARRRSNATSSTSPKDRVSSRSDGRVSSARPPWSGRFRASSSRTRLDHGRVLDAPAARRPSATA